MLDTFAGLIERTADDLVALPFVTEWIGPGERVPVFETASLREFASDPERRAFLAQLLASYTHVASGRTWTRAGRGWRKRRYSELDLLCLAEMVESLPSAARGPGLRRIGDLSLFLAGVFPDHAARHPLEPRHLARITRAIGAGTGAPPVVAWTFREGGVTILDWLGRVAYRRASMLDADVRSDVAARYLEARRFLNVLTDRYLFPLRERWFPTA